jgi:Peptidase family M23
MKRLVALLPVLIAFQAGAPPALAWTWPADGPVLRPFVLGDDPYAGGQHRGVDIAGPAGSSVLSPAAGVVSFAGTVPGGGRSVTVQTADGYSVTLVHLGSFGVAPEQAVAEGAALGTIGPSGASEHAEPYVHLGIRVTSDPHGYVDPLTLLPKERVQPPPAPPPQPSVPAPSEPEPPADGPKAPKGPTAEAPVPTPEPRAQETRRPEPAQGTRRPEPAPAVVTASQTSRGRTVAEARAHHQPASVPVLELAVRVPAGIAPLHSRTPQPRPVEHPRNRPVASDAPLATSPSRASEPPSAVLGRAASLAGATAVLTLGLGGLLLVLRRRRQLAEARPAHALPLVVDDRARRAAEDAGALGPAQEDRLVLDGDLESVALGQPEPLPDLDRDDDPAQLVQVPDDPCRRLRPAVSPHRFHRVGPRPSSPCRGAEPVSTR